MHREMFRHISQAADLVIMSAAVADMSSLLIIVVQKLPKKLLPTELKLVPVPDIIA